MIYRWKVEGMHWPAKSWKWMTQLGPFWDQLDDAEPITITITPTELETTE